MLIGSLVLASHGRLLRMLLAQQLGRPGQARPRLGVPVGRKSGTHFQLPKSGLGLHLDARDMSAAFLSARSSGLSGFRTAMRDRATYYETGCANRAGVMHEMHRLVPSEPLKLRDHISLKQASDQHNTLILPRQSVAVSIPLFRFFL